MIFRKSGYYFIALLFLAILGFWKSYFSNIFGSHNIYIHFHSATMLLWILMLITQAFLIRYGKLTLHKFIGKMSYGLIPLLVISLILLAHSQITIYEFGLTYTRLYVLFLQLSLLAIFIISYGLAIFYRQSAHHHARYMICTALTLIDPAVARIPLELPSLPFSYQVITFALTDFILIFLMIAERKQLKARSVFPIMLVIFLAFQTFNLTSTRNTIWDIFSLWFAELPLT